MMMMISKQGDDDDVDDTESNPITSWSVFMMMMLMTLILMIMKMMTMMIAIERDRDWTQSLTRLQAGQYSSQQTHPTLLYSSPYSQLVVFVYFCICIVITIVFPQLYSCSLPVCVFTFVFKLSLCPLCNRRVVFNVPTPCSPEVQTPICYILNFPSAYHHHHHHHITTCTIFTTTVTMAMFTATAMFNDSA